MCSLWVYYYGNSFRRHGLRHMPLNRVYRHTSTTSISGPRSENHKNGTRPSRSLHSTSNRRLALWRTSAKISERPPLSRGAFLEKRRSSDGLPALHHEADD